MQSKMRTHFKNVALAVNFARVKFVEKRHHNERIKDDRKVL